MELGKGVKPEKVDKVLAKVAGQLVAGEHVQFIMKCASLRPLIDLVVITNARFLALDTTSVKASTKCSATLADVRVVSCDAKRKSVQFATHQSDMLLLKGVAPEDFSALQGSIERGRGCPIPADLLSVAQSRSESTSPTAAAEADLQRYGRLVTEEHFAGRSIRLYEAGFVRVGGMFGKSKAEYERLLSIEATTEVANKTGLGRGVVALATMGANLSTSNKRGDVYLTIRTEAQVHVLHEDPPTDRNIRSTKRLEGAARSVLASRAVGGNAETPDAPPVGERATAERLRELHTLRDQGLISEDEYAEQRKRLLDEL